MVMILVAQVTQKACKSRINIKTISKLIFFYPRSICWRAISVILIYIDKFAQYLDADSRRMYSARYLFRISLLQFVFKPIQAFLSIFAI